jgi:hypothetical protein
MLVRMAREFRVSAAPLAPDETQSIQESGHAQA